MPAPEPAPTANPVADPAARLYRGDSGRAYHEDKRGVPAVALPWIHRLRAAKFAAWIRPADTVLEFGVGAGWNLARLGCARRLGADAADSPAIREALVNLGIEWVESTAILPSASLDVVICHHTLEHLLEPAAVLREFARLLKPGGRLVVHVPWEREARYARFDPTEPNHHLHGWNAQTLGNLVSVLGWRIDTLGVRRYGYDRFVAKLAIRAHLGETGFRALRAVLLRVRPLREVELVAHPPAG